ncbi:MAG: hypothetical protein ABR927_15700 [Bacteroidales bacterium]|jgi:hypothetical protein
MKTITNDFKRKAFFDMTIENHINGNNEIVRYRLSLYSKFDLIRFTNYLRHFVPALYIDINGNKKFDLFEV